MPNLFSLKISKANIKNRLLWILQGLGGILILSLLIYKANLSKIIEALASANLFWVFIGAIYFVALSAYSSLSLKVLLDTLKNIKYKNWFEYYIQSFTVSTLLPGKLGDFSIVYFLREQDIQVGEGIALVMLDKITTLFMLMVMFVVCIKIFVLQSLEYYFLFIVIMAIMCIYLIMTGLGRKILIFALGKYSITFSGFSRTIQTTYKYHKARLFANLLLTFIRTFLGGFLYYILLKAFGLNVSVFLSALVLVIITIVSIIPITPSGIGIRESIGVVLFSSLGVPYTKTLSMFIILIVFNYMLALVGFLFIIKYINKQVVNVKKSLD